MKFRLTLALLILNAIVYFLLLREDTPFSLEDRIGRDALGILPYSINEADSLVISGDAIEGRTYRLDNVGFYWQLMEPIEWEANPFAVRRMLNNLELIDTSIRFSVSDMQQRGETLANYGLENPPLNVTIGFGDESFELRFGAPTEIGERIYLFSEEEQHIYVVEARIIDPFVLPIRELRSNDLIAIPAFEISQITVDYLDDGLRFRLNKREEGWDVLSPIVADANDAQVQGLIDELIELDVERIESFTDNLDFNEIIRLEVVGNRRSATLTIAEYRDAGNVSDTFYQAMFEGRSTRFLISRAFMDQWRGQQDVFRERSLMSFDPYSVGSLSIVEPSTNQSLRLLQLENGSWRLFNQQSLSADMQNDADKRVVEEKLKLLNDAQVLEFISDAPSAELLERSGVETPYKRISLLADDEYILEIGEIEPSGLGRYARLQGNPSIYLVGLDLGDALSVNSLDYLPRDVLLFDVNTQQLNFLTITALAEDSGLRVEFDFMQESISGEVEIMTQEEEQAMSALMPSILENFRVAGYIDNAFDEAGTRFNDLPVIWDYRMQGFSSRDSQNPIFEILLSKRLNGTQQLGYTEGAPHIFLLSQVMIDALHRVIFDPEIPPERILPDLEDQNNANN